MKLQLRWRDWCAIIGLILLVVGLIGGASFAVYTLHQNNLEVQQLDANGSALGKAVHCLYNRIDYDTGKTNKLDPDCKAEYIVPSTLEPSVGESGRTTTGVTAKPMISVTVTSTNNEGGQTTWTCMVASLVECMATRG